MANRAPDGHTDCTRRRRAIWVSARPRSSHQSDRPNPAYPPAVRPHRGQRTHGSGGDRLVRRLRRHRLASRAGNRERRVALPRAHGLQGHRAPQCRPDRRGDRGRRRSHQRLHGARADRLLREGPEGGHRARRRHHRRHPHPFHLRTRGAGTRARRDPPGDRPGERHAGRHHLRSLPGARLSRPSRSAAPCWAPRKASSRCRAPR